MAHKHRKPYHEELLHWIWQTRNFETRPLQTTSGEAVTVYHPGSPNQSDGPDFTKAHIQMGSLQWHGDVEIHWKLPDWKAHGHGRDARYNNVILHVVFQETAKQSCREDNTSIPTLCIRPYLSQPLETFLNRYLNHPQLPCGKHLSYISEEAFARQLEKAHRQYFEQKVDDLSTFYDPQLPPSRAWLKLLSIAFFDGLGISHNRAPMRKLCRKMLEHIDTADSPEACIHSAMQLSGINGDDKPSSSFAWKHKGCRPASHPKVRIPQAALGLWHIYQQPFKRWMRHNPQTLWQELIQSITVTPSVGNERSSILFGTVFLPAMYILGNLFHITSLKERGWQLWKTHQVSLPNSLLKPLNRTDLKPSIYNKKLGTIHQLRNYCNKGACQKCFVFKNEISS